MIMIMTKQDDKELVSASTAIQVFLVRLIHADVLLQLGWGPFLLLFKMLAVVRYRRDGHSLPATAPLLRCRRRDGVVLLSLVLANG
jgi:hypothetical protein